MGNETIPIPAGRTTAATFNIPSMGSFSVEVERRMHPMLDVEKVYVIITRTDTTPPTAFMEGFFKDMQIVGLLQKVMDAWVKKAFHDKLAGTT